MLQCPDGARPRVLLQSMPVVVRHPRRLLSTLRRDLHHDMPRQQRDIVLARTKRWQCEREHAQARAQVLPESLGPRLLLHLPACVGKRLEEQDGDVLREGMRALSEALIESETCTPSSRRLLPQYQPIPSSNRFASTRLV